MGLPLDAVKTGDWLICLRGPYVERFTQIGEKISVVNKDPEGYLHKVLAVSAPFVLVKVFPMPCEDPQHPFHPPFNVTWRWNDIEFGRPSRGYVREYLKRGRPGRSPMPPETDE